MPPLPGPSSMLHLMPSTGARELTGALPGVPTASHRSYRPSASTRSSASPAGFSGFSERTVTRTLRAVSPAR